MGWDQRRAADLGDHLDDLEIGDADQDRDPRARGPGRLGCRLAALLALAVALALALALR